MSLEITENREVSLPETTLEEYAEPLQIDIGNNGNPLIYIFRDQQYQGIA